MSQQTIILRTNGNPTPGTEAMIYNNSWNENTITTSRSGRRIGVFKTTKDPDGFAEIELDKKVYEVYQDDMKITFTVGTTVEIEKMS